MFLKREIALIMEKSLRNKVECQGKYESVYGMLPLECVCIVFVAADSKSSLFVFTEHTGRFQKVYICFYMYRTFLDRYTKT